jgi:hypothetical protein
MNNVVDFPTATTESTGVNTPVDKPVTEDQRQAAAFRDLEGRLLDCVRMARIAREQVFDNYRGDDEELVFAVNHTAEMLEALKVDYLAAYENGTPIEP